MRRALFLPMLLLAVAIPAGACLARDRHSLHVDDGSITPPQAWGERHDVARARFAMPTREGSVVLLVTRRVVAVQLSDRTMRDIDRELDEERDEDDGAIGRAIRGAVLGGVRALLDHSLECPLADLRDVRYRDGRLELITADGGRVFEEVSVDDRDLLEDFRPGDARAFVAYFRQLRQRDR